MTVGGARTMEITEVRVMPSKGGKIKAFASIVIDDCFVVNDLRVIEAKDGHFMVTMPARKSRNGQMRDVAHPINAETRKMIEDRVLEQFEASRDNRALPVEGSDKSDDGRSKSPLDRLAGKLLAEDFWVGRDGGKES